MKLIQVSTQEIRASFAPEQERVLIGDLYRVSDATVNLVAQVYEINSNVEDSASNIACFKIMLSSKDDKWIDWQGEVPSSAAVLEKVPANILLSQFISKDSETITVGNLSQYQGENLLLGKYYFDSTSVVFSDKEQQKVEFTSLLAGELLNYGQKVVILDFNAEYADVETKHIKAGVDYKLPLDSKGIDRIYSKGLDGASPESKAVIEDVLIEVQNYANTCDAGFIPLDSFKKVVDDTYERLNITQLILLKNKLLKLEQAGVFANGEEETEALFYALQDNDLVIVDMYDMPQEWHVDFIDNIISQNILKHNSSFYLFFEGDETNSNLSLIKNLCVKGQKSGIKPVLTVKYASKYFDSLLSLAQNLFLFKPIRNLPESVLGILNYLSKLNEQEFIVCGESTRFVPIFANMPQDQLEEMPEPVVQEPVVLPKEELFVAPSAKKVSSRVKVQEQVTEFVQEEPIEEEPEYIDSYNQEEDFVDEAEVQDDDFLDLVEEAYQDEEDVLEYKEEDYSIDNIDFDSAMDESLESEAYKQEVQEEISKEVDSLYTKPTHDVHNIEPVENKIPVYSARYENEEPQLNLDIQEGDMVRHQKYGTGVVKKIISYGNKSLCSIHFDEVGRRLLDPELAVIEKI